MASWIASLQFYFQLYFESWDTEFYNNSVCDYTYSVHCLGIPIALNQTTDWVDNHYIPKQ